jgi:hypothetical protein
LNQSFDFFALASRCSMLLTFRGPRARPYLLGCLALQGNVHCVANALHVGCGRKSADTPTHRNAGIGKVEHRRKEDKSLPPTQGTQSGQGVWMMEIEHVDHLNHQKSA